MQALWKYPRCSPQCIWFRLHSRGFKIFFSYALFLVSRGPWVQTSCSTSVLVCFDWHVLLSIHHLYVLSIPDSPNPIQDNLNWQRSWVTSWKCLQQEHQRPIMELRGIFGLANHIDIVRFNSFFGGGFLLQWYILCVSTKEEFFVTLLRRDG